MEQLLHYVWKHRLYPLAPMQTTEGLQVEIIDPGLHNRDSGPDFFNAKVKIDSTLWVGNVEIHDRSSDWYLHGHDHDEHYNNVILHVVGEADREVVDAEGKCLPQLCLSIPESVRMNYEELLHADDYPPCYRVIPGLSRLMIHSWMSALQTERLMQKTEAIMARVEHCGGSWEEAYFVTLARNYGFGVNGDAFEQWAEHIPLHDVDHHRDDLFQIEALFMGQAGLLSPEAIPERYREAALADDYMNRLTSEYRYLAHKFGLTPMDHRLWRFLRLRPQNFPHIRISELTHLYYRHQSGMSQLLACTTIKEVTQLLRIGVTPYWENHYTFGVESQRSTKAISAASIRLLIINTVVPVLFAYGRYKQEETLCDRAFDFLRQVRAEDNHIVRMWQECGLTVENAGDSQALIQLKKEYCDRKECLRCRIGYEYLKRRKPLLTSPEGSGTGLAP
jgi:hypothetical protein